jgi:hypothetical protein
MRIHGTFVNTVNVAGQSVGNRELFIGQGDETATHPFFVQRFPGVTNNVVLRSCPDDLVPLAASAGLHVDIVPV